MDISPNETGGYDVEVICPPMHYESLEEGLKDKYDKIYGALTYLKKEGIFSGASNTFRISNPPVSGIGGDGKTRQTDKKVRTEGKDKPEANVGKGVQWIGGFDEGSPLALPAQTETSFLDDKNYVKNMHVSANLVNYLKEWEGIKGTTNPATKEYYDRVGKKWTIGYGHVENTNERVKYAKGITPEEAEQILMNDIITKGESQVKALFKGYRFTQNEFDALVDLAFNSGAGNMANSNLPALIKAHSTDKNIVKSAFEQVTKRAPERKRAEGAMYTIGEYPSPSYLKR